MERQVSRHHARLLEGRWRASSAISRAVSRAPADLYEASGRKPHASINFITAHDGFTLDDLVSYNEKHNEANGEENRDGHNQQSRRGTAARKVRRPTRTCWHCARARNGIFIATLLLSQGVPMLLAGDELGHTQRGNNNAYCQDNEITWLDWELTAPEREFCEFVVRMIGLRRAHPVFSRRRFLRSQALEDGAREVAWLKPDGTEMSDTEWHQGFARCLGVYVSGSAIQRVTARGQPVRDESFLLLCNAHHEVIPFTLPEFEAPARWRVDVDTAETAAAAGERVHATGAPYPLAGRSLTLLCVIDAVDPALKLRAAPAAEGDAAAPAPNLGASP